MNKLYRIRVPKKVWLLLFLIAAIGIGLFTLAIARNKPILAGGPPPSWTEEYFFPSIGLLGFAGTIFAWGVFVYLVISLSFVYKIDSDNLYISKLYGLGWKKSIEKQQITTIIETRAPGLGLYANIMQLVLSMVARSMQGASGHDRVYLVGLNTETGHPTSRAVRFGVEFNEKTKSFVFLRASIVDQSDELKNFLNLKTHA